ncbi:MAG: phosphoribosylanthranilate isomerase [Betaproteobacteria bacterium]
METELSQRTRIKICGITCTTDGVAAAEAGADAIGFVFHPASPRAVAAEAALQVARELPPLVTVVGLFVDAAAADVRRILAAVPLGLLQFHGDEPDDYCRQFGIPYLKAVRVRPTTDLLQYAASHAGAGGLLLDAYRAGVPGGTGEVFDWGLIPEQLPCRVVLSGGLNANNVAAGVTQVRPWAVDVSSGVESAPGIKDRELIRQFIRAVRRADAGQPTAE